MLDNAGPLSVHTGGTEMLLPKDFRWPGGKRIGVFLRMAFEKVIRSRRNRRMFGSGRARKARRTFARRSRIRDCRGVVPKLGSPFSAEAQKGASGFTIHHSPFTIHDSPVPGREDEMRLVTFSPQAGGAPRVGMLRDGDEVIDLTHVGGNPPFDPAAMVSLIAAGGKALSWLRDVASKGKDIVALDGVRLHAPVPRPPKNVYCVGWNYLDHFEEGAKARTQKVDLPEHPAFFSKAATSVTGPHDTIPFNANVSKQIDWEVELGLVIGPGGKNIPEAEATKHVFGYTVINDISARDIQRRHNQWFKGKSLDGSCPMGPWIVTADAVKDPDNLRLRTRVNGAVKQDSSTSYLYFKLPRIIAELSLGLTLEAGDIIATGTPSGVGYARTPPEFLKPGDVLETEIEGIGLLHNTIGA